MQNQSLRKTGFVVDREATEAREASEALVVKADEADLVANRSPGVGLKVAKVAKVDLVDLEVEEVEGAVARPLAFWCSGCHRFPELTFLITTIMRIQLAPEVQEEARRLRVR